MVCATKDEGGLGVLNLGNHNEVLLMKYLHKFYNREDIPWVSLVWEKYYSNGRLPENSNRGSFWWFIHKYKDVARIDLKDGGTCLLWYDMWLGIRESPSKHPRMKIASKTFSTCHYQKKLTPNSSVIGLHQQHPTCRH